MSRERIITNLQQAVYILNFAAVCLVAGSMTLSIFKIVDAMEAEIFLNLIQVKPWKPRTMLILSITGYLCPVLLSCLGQLWEHKSKSVRLLITVGEMFLCIGTTVAMNMNYNGLVLLVVADMVRGQKGSRHGHADTIRISISKTEQWLTICVDDNGIGCDDVKEGFGLKHMEERINLLEGTLEYGSREGFYIIARIPTRWGEEHL